MDLIDYLTIIFILDGPIVALAYFLWKRLRKEEEHYEKT
tara:strand:- start:219 stop:335 length:117 start_codon:yes stop_codon:yes gene_type:complete